MIESVSVAALLTYKIRNLWSKTRRKDFANLRHVRRLVHQRVKILKYLKRVDFQRWETCLQQIGIFPASLEGEINIVK